MFTVSTKTYDGNIANQEKVLVEAACLSTDSKPTDGIANGSICLEMDTGKVYAYNEAGEAWVELQ